MGNSPLGRASDCDHPCLASRTIAFRHRVRSLLRLCRGATERWGLLESPELLSEEKALLPPQNSAFDAVGGKGGSLAPRPLEGASERVRP